MRTTDTRCPAGTTLVSSLFLLMITVVACSNSPTNPAAPGSGPDPTERLDSGVSSTTPPPRPTALDAGRDGAEGGSSPVDSSSPPPQSPSGLMVSLTAPGEGAILKGSVAITAAASANVVSVDFRWDSESFPGALDTMAPFSFTWDTTTFTDGSYTLTALAKDGAGDQVISNPVTVRVANRVTVDPPPITPPPPVGTGTIRRVPKDHATIQAAINAAKNGDTVLVSPGTYPGGLSISGKAITLASEFQTTGQASAVDGTIITGGEPILEIDSSARNSTVVGFTFKGGRKGVTLFGHASILNNKFLRVGADAVSLEDSGGVIRGNYFESPSDDAIDGDGPLETVIEGNTMKGAGDDGIEIRNFGYSGTKVTITIRSNVIIGSDEDGIQLIDYDPVSNRVFLIERNLIQGSADAGLGIMDKGETREDFRAAPMPERVHLVGNTFVGNRYGVTGGANLVAVNNIISGSTTLGMKGIAGKSAASYNLFWDNKVDTESSNVDRMTSKFADPLFTPEFHLKPGSPAIDAGTARFSHEGQTVLEMTAGTYAGNAPDLGWNESGAP